jgi:hypothetical protein
MLPNRHGGGERNLNLSSSKIHLEGFFIQFNLNGFLWRVEESQEIRKKNLLVLNSEMHIHFYEKSAISIFYYI